MITNRKSARTSLVAAIKAGIPLLADDADGTAHTLGYLPKVLSGLSPICSVESSAAEYSSQPAEGNRFELVVGMWVNREDAATAEDQLDDLAAALAGVIDGWKTAEFSQPSTLDYADMDNKSGQYRVEFHYVSVEWE